MAWSTPGTPAGQGGNYGYYPQTEPRAAAPAPPVHRAQAFDGTEGWGDYDPSSSPVIPADEPFKDIGDDIEPVDGDLPDNIDDGGDGGIGDVDAEFSPYSADDFDDPADNIIV